MSSVQKKSLETSSSIEVRVSHGVLHNLDATDKKQYKQPREMTCRVELFIYLCYLALSVRSCSKGPISRVPSFRVLHVVIEFLSRFEQ